jgi:Uma2 family endonuclease
MATEPKTFLTPEEYLEHERKAEYKSEYYQGEMFAMAGASPRHADIITNIIGLYWQQLRGRPCRATANDVRLRIPATGLYTYPDVMVICGDRELADDQKDTVLNPTVIVEVLSDSTRDYDRGQKFEEYRTLSSLAEYLTVAQHTPHVERWRRQPDNGWLLTEFRDLTHTVELTSIGCVLPLSEIYDRITF